MSSNNFTKVKDIMKTSEALSEIIGFKKRNVSQHELGNALGVSKQYVGQIINKELTPEQIKQLEDYFKIDFTNVNQNNENLYIDYFPDVCGSCGNGVFQFSVKKELITVPQNAFFKKFSPVKKYFVINAYGNSMEPVFYDKDKLIVQQWEGEQIIDNKPYLFCYKDEIFIKKLAKNVDQLMIIPENKDYDIRKLEGKQLEDVNIIGLVVGLMRDLR